MSILPSSDSSAYISLEQVTKQAESCFVERTEISGHFLQTISDDPENLLRV